MSSFQPTRIVGVVNDTVAMALEFIEGKPFTMDLSLKVVSTFDLENTTGNNSMTAVGAGVNYLKLLRRLGYKKVSVNEKGNMYLTLMGYAKKRLTDNPVSLLGKDIFYIQLNQTTKLETALMVRYINICHKPHHVVVVNDEIVYIPEHYRHREHEELGRYVKLSILKHKDRTNKLVKTTKAGIRFIQAHMQKTVVTA